MDDGKLEILIKPLIRIYEDLELELIKDIAMRLNTYTGIEGSLRWYLDKLQEIGGFNKDNLTLIAKYVGKSQSEVKRILRLAGYDVSKLDKYRDYIEDEELLNNPTRMYKSVAVQNIIDNSIKETNSMMEIIQTKALESAKESYMKILTDSYIKVSSGVYSYDQVIKQALKDMAQEGFTGATYKNGKKLSLESTVRRDILTKVHQLSGNIQIEKAKQMKTNLVYVTQHLGARIRTKYTKEDYEVHYEWQGKVYMLDGSSDKYDNFYEKTGYGKLLGLCGVNCRHNFFPTFEGQSHPSLYDEEENEKEYLKKQQQRRYEARERQYKREIEGMKILGDKEELKKNYQRKKKFNKEYTQFLKENNLQREYSREYIEKDLIKVDYDTLSSGSKNISDSKLNGKLIENIKGKNYYDEIKKYELEIVDSDIENAIIIEEEGNVYRFGGLSDYVNIRANYKNAIITHNHPTFMDEIGGSFGKNDFITLMNHQDIKELRVVDEKYTYTIRTLKPIKESDYDNAYRSAKLIDNDYKHCVMEELKEKGLIYYERRTRERTR